MTNDFTQYELAQARQERHAEYVAAREKHLPPPVKTPVTKHGLTEEQCGQLADAAHALRTCRRQLEPFLPVGKYESDPLEKVIQAAQRLAKEEVIQ